MVHDFYFIMDKKLVFHYFTPPPPILEVQPFKKACLCNYSLKRNTRITRLNDQY